MLMNKNHEKELLENTVKRFVEEELYLTKKLLIRMEKCL